MVVEEMGVEGEMAVVEIEIISIYIYQSIF
jgi:hypothetical protein